MDGVKFYGVPMFIEDCITDRQSRNYASIPDDTDVLITHSPAYGILDFDDGINYGSEEILSRISELHLKAYLFGHIHAQHGVAEQNGIIFSNGSIMNADYTTFESSQRNHLIQCLNEDVINRGNINRKLNTGRIFTGPKPLTPISSRQRTLGSKGWIWETSRSSRFIGVRIRQNLYISRRRCGRFRQCDNGTPGVL